LQQTGELCCFPAGNDRLPVHLAGFRFSSAQKNKLCDLTKVKEQHSVFLLILQKQLLLFITKREAADL
jgi:hypothetical protein